MFESDNFLLLKKVRIEHKSVVLSTLGFRFTQSYVKISSSALSYVVAAFYVANDKR